MADVTNIINAVRTNLRSLNKNKAVTLLIDNKTKLADNLGELVPIITAQINSDVEREKLPLFACSKNLLAIISEEYAPEDVLLQFIDEIERFNDDTAFVTLLAPLEVAVLRVPQSRLNSLGWGLNSINSYLKKALIFENANINENEETVTDVDSLFPKMSFLYVPVLAFYKSLIQDFKKGNPTLIERKVILLKFMLHLLGKPLAFENLGRDAKSQGKCRRIAESVVDVVFALTSDIFWILNMRENSEYDIGHFDDLSLATLYYLVLGEGLSAEKVPKVYDPIYIFQNGLHLATELFKHPKHIVTSNGLCLTNSLLNTVDGLTLSYRLLESEHHSQFCLALVNTVIYSPIKQYRQIGLELFRKYLFCFETQGRYLLVYNLAKNVRHAGIVGYVIGQYKEMFLQELNEPSAALSVYFRGRNLISLVNIFCYLHNGKDSNLLELADQIVASLNFLRFLAIRDRANSTKMWDHFEVLDKKYLEPLKQGIMLSKMQYQMKVKEVMVESAEGDKIDCKVSVTVAGQNLTQFPTNEKLRALYSAITTFDVIESLLSRVKELIEDKPAGVSR